MTSFNPGTRQSQLWRLNANVEPLSLTPNMTVCGGKAFEEVTLGGVIKSGLIKLRAFPVERDSRGGDAVRGAREKTTSHPQAHPPGTLISNCEENKFVFKPSRH